MKCRYCPRLLHTEESKARGYGLICGQKLGLIPKRTRRRARALTPVTTPTVHFAQTAIPIQPQLPQDGTWN